MWFLLYIYALLFKWKSKKQKKRNLEVALPSAMTIALDKENLKKLKKHAFRVHGHCTRHRKFKKNKKTPFAECRCCGTRQRGLKKQISLPSVRAGHSAKSFFKKNRRHQPSADGVKSLPSARTALGKAFAECLKFGTRQSSLDKGFAECKAVFAECNSHSAKSLPPVR